MIKSKNSGINSGRSLPILTGVGLKQELFFCAKQKQESELPTKLLLTTWRWCWLTFFNPGLPEDRYIQLLNRNQPSQKLQNWSPTVPKPFLIKSIINAMSKLRMFLFVCLFYLSSWLVGKRQTLSIGHLPRPTFGDTGSTMSACFFIWFFIHILVWFVIDISISVLCSTLSVPARFFTKTARDKFFCC